MGQQINTDGLRALAVKGTLLGKSISFGAEDVLAVADELDTARKAVAKLGDYLDETRNLLTESLKPDLLDAERKRIRGDADALLARVAEMLGESKIVLPDTVAVPGSDLVQ